MIELLQGCELRSETLWECGSSSVLSPSIILALESKLGGGCVSCSSLCCSTFNGGLLVQAAAVDLLSWWFGDIFQYHPGIDCYQQVVFYKSPTYKVFFIVYPFCYDVFIVQTVAINILNWWFGTLLVSSWYWLFPTSFILQTDWFNFSIICIQTLFIL